MMIRCFVQNFYLDTVWRKVSSIAAGASLLSFLTLLTVPSASFAESNPGNPKSLVTGFGHTDADGNSVVDKIEVVDFVRVEIGDKKEGGPVVEETMEFRSDVIPDTKEDLQKELKKLNAFIFENPLHGYAYYRRAETYKILGEYDKMLADYTKSIELRPRNCLAYEGRGTYYFKQGDYRKAVADLTESIKNLPTHGAYDLRARAYKKLGKDELAAQDIKAADKCDVYGVIQSAEDSIE